MPPTFDLRTYAKLEAALIRHLVKDWRRRSAPIFADIATACRNRQWDEARRRVPELDLQETGAENKEWIKYHLHSMAVFGAGQVAKQRPSFVGVGAFETTLNQVAQNVITYLELTATSQVQAQTLQLIAEDEAQAKKKVAWEEAQHPRDKDGQFSAKLVATFEQGLETAEDYASTKFILPDGTRLAHRSDSHWDAAQLLGVDMFDAMRASIIRYTPGTGGEVGGPITIAQAQHLVDASQYSRGNNPLFVDVFVGKTRDTKTFDYHHATADAVRHWVNAHFATTKFDPAQPRDDAGRWVTVYHGTRARDVASILREGLRPSKEGLVWATESKAAAQAFAEGLDYPEPTVGATVVEIRAPKSAFFFEKPLTPGRKDPKGARTVRFPGPVRPEWIVKFDPQQPRDEQGQWTKGHAFTSDEGYNWHETGPGAAWAKQLPYADVQNLSGYAGFGYHAINDLRRGTYVPRTIGHFVRAATEEEYKASQVTVDEEYLKHYPHPFGSRPETRTPDEPYERVLDAGGKYVGHISSNVFYKNPAGESVRFSVQRAGPDVEAQAQVQKQADQLDDLIANRGLALKEPITVLRGAYLPGVTPEDLQDMALGSKVYEEKGFTSTFLGEAGGRARSYPALGKWESIYNRFKGKIAEHQDEVGTAVQFHITLPAGTKVASVEAARRLEYEFPRIPDPSPRPADIAPEYWTMRDYTAQPTVKDTDLHDKSRRSESEILIGSGAQFKVKNVQFGYTSPSGDPTLKPVKVYEVHLEYIGGGSSERQPR